MIYIASAVFFYFLNYFFIKFWKKKNNFTPTGVGIFLIFHLIHYFLIIEYSLFYLIPLIIFSCIYFLDDLISVNFIWRLIIQTLTPIIIYLASMHHLNIIFFISVIVFFFVLMNSLNFQDGEDLNIVILLGMIFFTFYFSSENILIKKTSIFILVYLFIFSIFNSKKNNLFFGDSGCFLISVIILMFVINDFNNKIMIKLFLSVIIFPIIDVFFVVFYRIYKNENLLSRNYHHIYQVLKKKTRWKLYLLPNIIFALVNILISTQISLNVNLVFILVSLNLLFCIIVHVIINNLKNYNEN
jgi:UDP-N-acetylmuramyl pentapeptide phosphotransferase/UDP-N-acetylglucosamine-1-phosphate transferase